MTIIVSAVSGAAAALLIALPFWLVGRRRRARGQREALQAQEAVAEQRRADVLHLAQVVLPALAERARSPQRFATDLPGPPASAPVVGEDFTRAVGAVYAALTSDEGARQERALRDSVQSAYEAVARTMHAMATVQQGVLDEVGQDVEDPDLMAQIMRADHAAAQMIHTAQTLLVMCGIWPARRESRPVSLYDCVRGAQSRIIEFSRVQVHGGQTVYAVAPAVEGLMHVLAELCQNATAFSPPTTSVIVTFREVGAGVVVEIDDAGLGMAADVLDRAVTSLREEADVTQLGAMPRLGLACVGRWARELGLTVDLSGASAYGGVRATVFVPHRLLTDPVATPAAGTAMPSPATSAAVLPAQRTPVEAGPSLTAQGLPQRHSRRARIPGAPAPAPHLLAPAAVPDGWGPQEAGASVAGVVAGVRRGREDSGDHPLPAAPPYPMPPHPGTWAQGRPADAPPWPDPHPTSAHEEHRGDQW